MPTIQYPVLTYGTLRPDCGNYRYHLEGFTVQEETVELNGFQMRGDSGFPYVLEVEGCKIVATLNYINPEKYDSVVESLDRLEGYRNDASINNHYDRVLIDFESNGIMRKAYIYVARSKWSKRMALSLPIIESGDWIGHNRQTRPEYARSSY